MKYLPATAVFALALITGGVASAANTTSTQAANTPASSASVTANANSTKGADQINHTNLRQDLQDKLSKAGFTDIKVMPSSFYIQAKDKNGQPVAMVIGPDSFVEVTDISSKTNNAQPQASAQQKTGQQNSSQQSSKD